MSFFNKNIKKESIVSKTFSYSKGKVSLNFTLRIDIKQEMKDFVELLKVALEELENEIIKI